MTAKTHLIKHLICILLIPILLCISLIPVHASSVSDSTQDISNTINLVFKCEDARIDGASFDAIKIGDVQYGAYVWTDEVEALSNFTYSASDLPDKVEEIAEVLSNKADSLTVTASKTTDKNGELTFTNLDSGIYLIRQTGRTGTAEHYTISSPFLTTIPFWSESGDYLTENTVYPKTEPEKIAVKSVKVQGTKTWCNDTASTRPQKITIHLLANGSEIAQTTVSANDNWTYSFENIPASDSENNAYAFTIEENAVSNYTFSQDEAVYGDDVVTINIKNTYVPDTVISKLVKTGDTSPILAYSIIAGAALIIIVALIITKKKRNKE